jgi:hypothetical protein
MADETRTWRDILGAALVALAAGVGVFLGSAVTGYLGLVSKNEELRVHLLEIAFGILRADPKEGVAPAREWAIKVIDSNSDVKFSQDEQKALLLNPIATAAPGLPPMTEDVLKQIEADTGYSFPATHFEMDRIRKLKAESYERQMGLQKLQPAPPAAQPPATPPAK